MPTLSSHLISSYHSTQQASRGPFGGQSDPNPTNLVQTANGYYNSAMHGNFGMGFGTPNTSMANSTFFPIPTQDVSEATAIKIADLQAKLDKRLGPEYISTRPGGGGMKLTYVEGWKAINLANEVFGFNGWSSSIVNMTVDFLDYIEQSQRYNVGVSATIRVILRDGTFHEDIGYGLLENAKQKGPALDKCKKEAVTDGIKRALRNFGNVLGNCLYDKSYTAEVTKIKVPIVKFDRSTLYRRPEFAETSEPGPSRRDVPPPNTANNTFVEADRKPVIPEIVQPAAKPVSSIPHHIKSEPPKLVPGHQPGPSSRPVPMGLPTPDNSIISPNPPRLPLPRTIANAIPSPSSRQDKGKHRDDNPQQEPEPPSTQSKYFGDDDDAIYAQIEIDDDEYSYIPADSAVVVDESNDLGEELVLAGLDAPPSPPETNRRLSDNTAPAAPHPPTAKSRSREASPNSRARRREAVMKALEDRENQPRQQSRENIPGATILGSNNNGSRNIDTLPTPGFTSAKLAMPPSTKLMSRSPSNSYKAPLPLNAGAASSVQGGSRAPMSDSVHKASPSTGSATAASRSSVVGAFHFPDSSTSVGERRMPSFGQSGTVGSAPKRAIDGTVRRPPLSGPGMGLSSGGVSGGAEVNRDQGAGITGPDGGDWKRLKR